VLVASSSLEGSTEDDDEASLGSRRALPASLIRAVTSPCKSVDAKSSDRKSAIKHARFTDKSGTDIPALSEAWWQLKPKSINLVSGKTSGVRI
jgi:hypothetical protein